MKRMLGGLAKRAGGAIKGGVYVSCIARGPNLFGAEAQELGLIAETLGEFPLVGFFANGEICRDRLYGYTGVLTLFL
jgi:small ligand-binding sensory domain FIST